MLTMQLVVYSSIVQDNADLCDVLGNRNLGKLGDLFQWNLSFNLHLFLKKETISSSSSVSSVVISGRILKLLTFVI